MIRIFPTTSSGLSAITYGLKIPTGDGLNLGKEKPESVATNLDGSATVTSYAWSIEGHQTSTTVELTETQYATLRSIHEHQTVDEWVVSFFNRSFTATVSITSATPFTRFGVTYWRCSIRFTLVSELHR